jgi:DNA repair exonuclease SbcCD ATPase subunit
MERGDFGRVTYCGQSRCALGGGDEVIGVGGGSIYLERIELSNFRAFGDSFSLELPNGPGITLVYGPNGFGKTTLFDGIEWCLTNDISRFSPYLSGTATKRIQHLTRLGAPKGSHRVSLSFTATEPIDRGRGFVPDSRDIVRLLKRPDWPEVSDLGRYLSITHFLGQSAAQRFSVKQPTDQWEALKGPVGIDRLNHIKDRIGGQATRQAFTRYLRQAESTLIAATQSLSTWNSLLDRLSRLRSLSASAEALTPADVLNRCADAVRKLQMLDPNAPGSMVADQTPEAALEHVQLSLALSRQLVSSGYTRLQRLNALLDELTSIRSELQAAEELSSAAEREHSSLTSGLIQASDAHARASLELAEAQQVELAAERRLQAVAHISENLVVLSSSLQRAAEIDAQLEELAGRISAADARTAELKRVVADAEQRSVQHQSLAARVRRLQAAISITEAIQSLDSAAREEESVGDPAVELLGLKEQRRELEVQAQACKASVDLLEKGLDTHDRRNALIAASVAQIASTVGPEDLDCPVCQTHFAAGQLLSLVRANAELPRSGARELGEALAAKRLELEAISRALSDVGKQEVRANERAIRYAAGRARAEQLGRQLTEMFDAEPLADLESLRGMVTLAEAELEATEAAMASLPLEDDLQLEATSVAGARTADISLMARLRAERADVIAAHEKASATLRRDPGVWNEQGGMAIPLEDLRLSAATAAAAASGNLRARNDVLSALSEELDVRRAAVAEATAQRDAHRRRRSRLIERQSELTDTWLSLGVTGEPDTAAIWQERDRLAELDRILVSVQQQLELTHSRYRSWLQDEELAECERDVRRLMDASEVNDHNELSTLLERRVLDAADVLKRAARTKEMVDEVVVKLKEMATTYTHDVLQPLNDSIHDFSTTLLTRADGSLSYASEQRMNQSRLKPAIRRTDSTGRTESLDMNPNLFFSEGQLSALSVSALLAASTNFRWSRWPALLMDDPLQHNDIIHASAFIDLLRRLVSELGYQVILSSHDASEADFVGRKCRSAGVDFTLCELVARGESGIVSSRF